MGDKLMQIKHKLIAYLFLVFLIILMIIPIGNTTSLINNTFVIGFRGDYILHTLIYLPWMFVGRLLLDYKLNTYLWLVLGLIMIFGLEYIQILLPYRGFNINDIIAGAIGVILSFVISAFTKLKIRLKNK